MPSSPSPPATAAATRGRRKSLKATNSLQVALQRQRQPGHGSSGVSGSNNNTALMPPPPLSSREIAQPFKRQKRPSTVLDEEMYTDSLARIIARDYFPQLHTIQAQEEYLNALESGNATWIREAGEHLTKAMTPGRVPPSMTPQQTQSSAKDETPRGWVESTPGAPSIAPVTEDGKQKKSSNVDTNQSLSSFQAQYTSEDNESFNALLDKQNAQRASKYTWLFTGNRLASRRSIAQAELHARLLKSAAEGDEVSQALVIRRAQDAREEHDRPAMPEYRPSNPRNGFFFLPDGVEDEMPTVRDEAERASTAPPRSVNHAATRFAQPATDLSRPKPPPSPSLSAISDAIHHRPPRHPPSSAASIVNAGDETPQISGYKFVDAEPTAAERAYQRGELPAHDNGDTSEEDEKIGPEHAGLGLLSQYKDLSTDSSGGNGSDRLAFGIRDASAREKLHHRLVDKANKQRLSTTSLASGSSADRGGGDLKTRTMTPKFTSAPKTPFTPFASTGASGAGRRSNSGGGGNAAGSLTPAAQALLSRVGGATPRREGGLFDSDAGRGGATPKVKAKGKQVGGTPIVRRRGAGDES